MTLANLIKNLDEKINANCRETSLLKNGRKELIEKAFDSLENYLRNHTTYIGKNKIWFISLLSACVGTNKLPILSYFYDENNRLGIILNKEEEVRLFSPKKESEKFVYPWMNILEKISKKEFQWLYKVDRDVWIGLPPLFILRGIITIYIYNRNRRDVSDGERALYELLEIYKL